MTDKQPPEENLAEEFQNLGKNLVEVLRNAWEHPERKRLQEEVVEGLTELGTTLKREADNFANSGPGQQLKTNMEEIGARIRSTDTQAKVRREMISALQTANQELQKVIDKLSQASQSADEPAGAPPAQEKSEKTS